VKAGKRKRRIHSFEPDADVAMLLDLPAVKRIKLKWLVNQALRDHLQKLLSK
jgi:hypothetical protein